MVMVLANTNNYKDALTLMEGLKNPSETSKKTYPRSVWKSRRIN
jgi:hypothetical protein